MEQESIFGTEFPDAYPRRRDLLPLVAKIYAWVAVVIGAFYLLATAGMFLISAVPDPQGRPVTNGQILMAVMCSVVFFLISIPVLLGKKYAIIICNLLAFVFLAFDVIVFLIMSTALAPFILTIVFFPYWLMLRRIQRKWEFEAQVN
ncbi:hypothetical protein [Chitinophaga jiangningensis]|nr:hypothetical protein [Chitinophaga jiangningensis]